MIRMGVKIDGKDQILANLKIELEKLKNGIDEAIQGAGINTQAMAKQLCPVDTGRLRASILYNPGVLSCTVYTNVNYAWFVELGHRTRGGKGFVPAQPFLYPAFERAVTDFKTEIKGLV